MRKYSGIHRRQLFHWIGRHIEKRLGKGRTLQNQHREDYLDCLRESLEKGIRVRVPEDPDGLLDRTVIRSECPMACFTEWSVADSLHHTSGYGRLGLGFPRNFVLRHGGRPVTYLSATTQDPATKSMLRLARFFDREEHSALREDWLQVSQFLKPLRPWSERKARSSEGSVKRKRAKKTPSGEKEGARRSFGGVMQYLEEREWRIIRSGKGKALVDDEKGGEGCFHLPIQSGKDLFTLVLPDHPTHAMLVRDKNLMSRLISPDQPPVTILTLDDIDTF